jgi:hypothetical protein
MMLERLRERVVGHLREAHRSESGAVILMCLAAFLILFMTTLVMYDAGQVARDKVDAQTGADVHAYSQAATKARVMNMIAFQNISKRTLVGVHNTYWAMIEAYWYWWAGRCGSCSMWNPRACLECAWNAIILEIEKFDWYHFTGWYWEMASMGLKLRTWYPFFGPLGTSWTGFQWQVYQLDQNQRYEVITSPYWAWGEGIIRGARNGASITGSYPPLANPLTVGTDWINLAVSAFGGSSSSGTSWVYDFLPVANWNKVVSATPRAFPVWVGLGTWLPTEGCLAPAAFNPLTGASMMEIALNTQRHKELSGISLGWIRGPDSGAVVNAGRLNLLAGFCMRKFPPVFFGSAVVLAAIFIPFVSNPFAPLMWLSMAPFHFTAPGNSHWELSEKSNIVFGYRQNQDLGGTLADNYDAFDGITEYTNTRDLQPEASGVWALSASEVVFPESNYPFEFSPGVNGSWMYHTGWTAKLRPAALPGEHASLGFGFDNMLRDVAPFMDITQNIIGVWGPEYSGGQADEDMAVMQKAAESMDSEAINGVQK